jgi:DNA-binding CsgD family transcriptional regulator
VKVIRRSEQLSIRPVLHRERYFFYEKNTGVSHFNIEAEPDGQFPLEQAAGLLAMHCMVRGQAPSDYIVMVQAESDFIEGLREKAGKLLQAGQSVTSSVRLTRREEEVLSGIMQSLANKEIAASLNLSERTVKFHVSSLLAKFGVRGRMELLQEASRRSRAMSATPFPVATREAREYTPMGGTLAPAARGMGQGGSPVPLAKRAFMA